MEEPQTAESSLHVVFTAAGQRYAVRHDVVLEMVQPPHVIPLPGAGKGVLGLINLRGRVLGLTDFRLALGMRSASSEAEELVDELEQRKQEHFAWLQELEDAVKQGREFRLTTDPHACAFGRWFDSFQTDNVMLQQLVLAFDEPHKRIHAIASTVLATAASGDLEGALRQIEDTREDELATMIGLFAETRAAIHAMRREIAIVISHEDTALAVLVDSVDAIESLDPCNASDLGDERSHVLVAGVATNSNNDLVLLVDDTALFGVFDRAA